MDSPAHVIASMLQVNETYEVKTFGSSFLSSMICDIFMFDQLYWVNYTVHTFRDVVNFHCRGTAVAAWTPTKAFDLNSLGGHLPLPRPDLPGRGNTTPLSPTGESPCAIYITTASLNIRQHLHPLTKCNPNKMASAPGLITKCFIFIENIIANYYHLISTICV